MKIPYYSDYISDELKCYLKSEIINDSDVAGLSYIGSRAGLETKEALTFLVNLYLKTREELNHVLNQRKKDRTFLDKRAQSYFAFNNEYKNKYKSKDYKTFIGDRDADGRVVIGPIQEKFWQGNDQKKIAPLPSYLIGNHVTLFGPPDDAKLSINAMNAYHRKLPNEPVIIQELLAKSTNTPKWGADDEDSKTPMRNDLISAAVNLSGCLNKNLSFKDSKTQKEYKLETEKLSFPIKRFPGLALPCPFMFYENESLPLHLYDFALHFYHHYKNPEALVFYVPKLENEEEARYIKNVMYEAEVLVQKIDPKYKLGTIKLIIVLENPRAVFRVNEMMDELFPYFAGASLGWHDYLGSTARLFKEDGNYRIPVKADPNIVINYIKASHDLVANVVGGRGGLKIGGMYGVLPVTTDLNSESFQVTLRGFFKDIITQMKRNLTGFWVAHPDFVRIGLALVEAWKLYAEKDNKPLYTMINSLLKEEYAKQIIEFVSSQDVKGLNTHDEMYPRSLIVADISESSFIANNHPDEIRYNVFQSLQYLTDWLSGNGCVALPAHIEGVPVRVMDDLATAERSRWEVWHEIHHNRFNVEDLIKIAHEEMNFIRRDLSDSKKIVQVKYCSQNAKWYDVAFKLMLKLMTDKKPVEFATELLLPFTLDGIRKSSEPFAEMQRIEPQKYKLESYIDTYNYYFEMCGSQKFAKKMSQNHAIDIDEIQKEIMNFEINDILSAASFHGNIGEATKNLDAMAKKEQEKVASDSDQIKNELLAIGEEYRSKFGFKFLISAKDKTAQYLLDQLKLRIKNVKDVEVENAKKALAEITLKRISAHPINLLMGKIQEVFKNAKVAGAQIAISSGKDLIQTVSLGDSVKGKMGVSSKTQFEIASLSKTFGSAFAINFFKEKGIPLESSVNTLLEQYKSDFRLTSSVNSEWANKVNLSHLMNHSALNMHYVNGVPASNAMPKILDFLNGYEEYQYPKVDVINEPGKVFKYSGAGFLVLEYLIELISQDSISNLGKSFFENLGLQNSSFSMNSDALKNIAHGYTDDGHLIKDGYKKFPMFAAGMFGTSNDVLYFLKHLTNAYHCFKGAGGISHDTAVQMLHGKDNGCQEFMNANMGLGVFTVEAGDNKFALHQGANDGYRAIYLYCYDGPDIHKGLCVLSNSELNGVVFNALATQEILKSLQISGIDFNKFKNDFSIDKLSQEEIVNIGYKKLVLDAFQPTLPEEIVDKGPLSPLANYNLAIGASIEKISNQRFARAENLISPCEPVFDPKLFGKQGKIMDSWETSRHNDKDYDELTLVLNKPEKISYIHLSTKYHFGNQVPFVELLGTYDGEDKEFILLEKMLIEGHAKLNVKIPQTAKAVKKVRVKVYPDGGLTRIGLFNELPIEFQKEFKPTEIAKSEVYSDIIPKTLKPLAIGVEDLKKYKLSDDSNFASLAYGAKVISATDEHYAPAWQVLSPFEPLDMFDGLESKRSRKPGHFEEVVFDLAEEIDLGKITLDFKYFVNNNPVAVTVFYQKNNEWCELVSKTNVKAYAGNKISFKIKEKVIAKRMRLVVTPDGGVNRIKVFKK